MDDPPGAWAGPLTLLADVGDVLALLVVIAALGLRVVPTSRRWAPRGVPSRTRRSAARHLVARDPHARGAGPHPLPTRLSR